MSDEDDKVRRGIQHLFSPDWAGRLGTKLGTGLREAMPDRMRTGAQDAAKRYVAWVEQQRSNPLPQAAQGPAKRAEDFYNDGAHPSARQDAELEVLRLQQEAARKQLAEQAPRDGGEIDEPAAVRQPVQMQREFSTNQQGAQDKEAYVEQVRRAQANAKKTQ